MISNKLKSIAVSKAPGQVGISLTYETGLSNHVLLPKSAAEQLRDRLSEALTSDSPGDGIGVSEHVSMKINDPKEH